MTDDDVAQPGRAMSDDELLTVFRRLLGSSDAYLTLDGDRFTVDGSAKVSEKRTVGAAARD